ncbi:MAG: arylsulfatase [Rhodothermales bacterium]
MRRFQEGLLPLCLVLVIGACRTHAGADVERPNILLLVADDLGYADLGIYGSDIRTPNIDALARRGMRFTQFHTAPMCAPTRAMLLSGNNNHVAGMGIQGGGSGAFAGIPGYEGHLSDRVAPLPGLLRDAGYHTYTVGKWHLGYERDQSPMAAGFERSFNLLNGAGNHFDAVGFHEGGSRYREDGEETTYPTGRYSTDLYTDRLIEFIASNRGDGRPFFAFAAYTSPHWPLQVPAEELDRYAGRYDRGYDALREERFASLKRAGIVPADATLPPRNDAIAPWETLSPERRREESRKMELYAAMVENLDGHVGRLIDYLKASGLYDNTLIVFMADNGAAAEDFYNVGEFRDYLRAHYDNRYENMGQPNSFVSYGPAWAEAGSAPFSRHKGYTREGGIVAPMIVAGPGVASQDVIDRSYLTVMDLAPTFIEIAGAAYPADGSARPMLGESVAGYLAGRADRIHDEAYTTLVLHGGRAFVRQGRWKLVTLEPPFSEEAFELFDVEADPGETRNLAGEEPETYRELLALWRTKRAELGIVLQSDLASP